MTRMSEDELTRKILELLSDIAPEVDPESIDRNQPLQRALDIDSYDFLNLLVAVRDQLGVAVDESDYDKVSTIADMVSFILPKLGSR
jgi:acyl carrier protein